MKLWELALKAAQKVSRDEQVFLQAADEALMEFITLMASTTPDDEAHPRHPRPWIQTVASNNAKLIAAKLHREVPFGRQGSLPPKMRDLDGDLVPFEEVMGLAADLQPRASSVSSPVVIEMVMNDALQRLSPRERYLIEARHFDGLSSAEIGAELGQTVQAIDVAVHRARKVLAKILTEDPRLG